MDVEGVIVSESQIIPFGHEINVRGIIGFRRFTKAGI